MEIFNNLNLIKNEFKNNTCVALGNFDGVHLGHQKIIESTIKIANDKNLNSVVFSFKNNPKEFFKKNKNFKYLTSFEEKIELLSKLDLDILICPNFDDDFSKISPQKFIEEIIINRLKAKVINVGFNYKFGNMREGNNDILKEICKKHNVVLNILDAVKDDENIINSTIIRDSLNNCEIKKANKLLGYNYFIKGKVIKGRNVGKNILGIPTANIYEDAKLFPGRGVYGVKVLIENHKKEFFGLLNIGNNPTFNYTNKVSLEVFILNFDEQIYDKKIRIEFLNFFRKENKFDTIQELREDILNLSKKIEL